MEYYRDKVTGKIYSPSDLEFEFHATTGRWYHYKEDKEQFIAKHPNLENITDLYEFLAEKYIWGENDEHVLITLEEAQEWIEYWKEDYDDFYVPVDPFTVSAEIVMAVWNYIVEWEAE